MTGVAGVSMNIAKWLVYNIRKYGPNNAGVNIGYTVATSQTFSRIKNYALKIFGDGDMPSSQRLRYPVVLLSFACSPAPQLSDPIWLSGSCIPWTEDGMTLLI